VKSDGEQRKEERQRTVDDIIAEYFSKVFG
jgi:hypothetical protein